MSILQRFSNIMSCKFDKNITSNKEGLKKAEKLLQELTDDLNTIRSEKNSYGLHDSRERRMLDELLGEIYKMEKYEKKAEESGDFAGARRFAAKKEKLEGEKAVIEGKYKAANIDFEKYNQLEEKLLVEINDIKTRIGQAKIALEEGMRKEKIMAADAHAGSQTFAKIESNTERINDTMNALEELNTNEEEELLKAFEELENQ